MLLVQDILNQYLSNNFKDDIGIPIAHYLQNHLIEIPTLSITQLAQNCHVSAASITRFCHTLGYDDFIHFKEECLRSTTMVGAFSMLPATEFFATEEASFRLDLSSVATELSDTIKHSLAAINLQLLDQLAKDMHDYDTVLFLGSGFSALTCLHLQKELSYRGKNCQVIQNLECLPEKTIKENVLFIAISMRGALMQLQPRMKTLLHKNVSSKSWLITQQGVILDPVFHSNLQIGCVEKEPYLYFVQLALADLILARYVKRSD